MYIIYIRDDIWVVAACCSIHDLHVVVGGMSQSTSNVLKSIAGTPALTLRHHP